MLAPPFALMIIFEKDSIVLLELSSTNDSHKYWTRTRIGYERYRHRLGGYKQKRGCSIFTFESFLRNPEFDPVGNVLIFKVEKTAGREHNLRTTAKVALVSESSHVHLLSAPSRGNSGAGVCSKGSMLS
jgi:hypothetical protein